MHILSRGAFMKKAKKRHMNKKKGDETMAISAKPRTGALIVDAKDKDVFFAPKNNTTTKAIERFMAHKPKDGIVNPFKK